MDNKAKPDSLRPQTLKEFIGQEGVCSNLAVFITAARERGEAMDHVLLSGPPGLGKTTLAQIIAHELGVGFRSTAGPVISKAGDLAALLTNLESRDVLFIDEIHRLNPAVEEVLYPAMEDFKLDLIIGEGPSARSVKIDLPPFTLIGATTRTGLLTTPLRDRFGIPTDFAFYGVGDLETIIKHNAERLKLTITAEGAKEIATRARGTPRVAGRLLRRVRDFAQSHGAKEVGQKQADEALVHLGIDKLGLNKADHRYLLCLAETFYGGPVGIDTLSSALSEHRDGVEDIVEPYLIQLGFIQRTARGRVLMRRAYEHLGLTPPDNAPQGEDLFTSE